MTKAQIRIHVAKLIAAAGCSCCRSDDEWNEQCNILGKALNIPKYDDADDDSYDGYNCHDFYKVAEDGE